MNVALSFAMMNKPEFVELSSLKKRGENPKMQMDTGPLDREREASMADEGSVSGAIMENEEGLGPEDWLEKQTGRPSGIDPLRLIA
jgi:hypothetical protein